jgi:putative transposase
MIDWKCPDLSVRRQCELLRLSRSGTYYEPVATSPDELALMRRIDEVHLKYPFYESPQAFAGTAERRPRRPSQAHPA